MFLISQYWDLELYLMWVWLFLLLNQHDVLCTLGNIYSTSTLKYHFSLVSQNHFYISDNWWHWHMYLIAKDYKYIRMDYVSFQKQLKQLKYLVSLAPNSVLSLHRTQSHVKFHWELMLSYLVDMVSNAPDVYLTLISSPFLMSLWATISMILSSEEMMWRAFLTHEWLIREKVGNRPRPLKPAMLQLLLLNIPKALWISSSV